jgi:large subunit ribosomal protein L9
MKVILTQDVDNLGSAGEVVTVKNGYGRNYLIPRGLAVQATPGMIRQKEEERKQASRRLAKAREAALDQKKQLENLEIPIMVKVGEENRIFGTVTSQQITTELTKRGFEVDRRNVTIDEEIRVTGAYVASVKLYEDVTASVKIQVMPEG